LPAIQFIHLVAVDRLRIGAVMQARTGDHHEAPAVQEAALRAVLVDDRPVCTGCRTSSCARSFHRDDFASVGLAGEQDAGIDRLVAEDVSPRSRRSTTVQAPQSPSAQPSLVPVWRSFSRR